MEREGNVEVAGEYRGQGAGQKECDGVDLHHGRRDLGLNDVKTATVRTRVSHTAHHICTDGLFMTEGGRKTRK